MKDTSDGPLALTARMEALADPTRLRILRLLERHELGVVELTRVLQLPQSNVSRHLKVLADRGYVRARAQGTANLYGMEAMNGDRTPRRLWLLARAATERWTTARQDQLRLEPVLADRRSAPEAFFAGAAGAWDRLRDEMYGHGFTQAALLSLLPPDLAVADLGCGTGMFAAALAPHVTRVIGVDQSAAMLKAARKRTESLANVELRQGSLEALPIEDATCDAALLVLALSYVLEPRLVVAEMARILPAGGRAIIVDLLSHDREDFRRQMSQQYLGFEPAELTTFLDEAGFVQASVRALPPDPTAQGPALLLATATRAGHASPSAATGEGKDTTKKRRKR